MVKPDGVARGLVQKIKERILKSGLNIVESRVETLSLEEVKKLYKVHEGKSFYGGLIKFITSGSVCLIKVEGENAIAKLRGIMGSTDPRNAEAGSIRGDFREENIFTEYGTMKNIIHGSDSVENAKTELALFFPLV